MQTEPTNTIKYYDYIIAGGGMAGLSLAYYLAKSEVLRQKKILIIDKEPKTKNDRTWCFWEIGEGTFEEIIFRKWQTVRFIGTNDFDKNLDIGHYQYKMLRGIDFYNFVLKNLRNNPNITFQCANISHITTESVITDMGTFTAISYIFDSITLPKFDNPLYNNLLQHFKGYVIEADEANFDVSVPIMMDFQLNSSRDECQFMYVLPFDKKTALVEFTLFSEKLLQSHEYDSELKKYISQKLNLADYQILEEEFGVIPMSDEPLKEFVSNKIMRIGTAGGYTNPATGYTFAHTQNRLKEIVENLEKTNIIAHKNSTLGSRFDWYASILLNVLKKKRHSAADIFTRLYQKNPADRIFRFLSGATTFNEDLHVLNAPPKWAFLKAAFDNLSKLSNPQKKKTIKNHTLSQNLPIK